MGHCVAFALSTITQADACMATVSTQAVWCEDRATGAPLPFIQNLGTLESGDGR